jgi:hypothetical protein
VASNLTSTAQAADQASNLAAAAAANAASLKAAITAAGAALNDPTLTEEQKAVAKQNFQDALKAYSTASSIAANAAAASTAAAAQLAASQSASNTVNDPSSNISIVRGTVGLSDNALASVGQDVVAAATGKSLEPSTDTSGLATDSTVSGMSSKLDQLGSGTSTGSYDGLPSSFYTAKYPDGLSGVWSAKKSSFENTSFKRAVNTLMPTNISGGSCPSWTFPDVLGMHVGDLEPPCSIWPVLRIFFMITTLFYSRRIIFGG